MIKVEIDYDPETNRMAVRSQMTPANTLRLLIRAMVDCGERVVDKPPETKIVGVQGPDEGIIAAKVSRFLKRSS